ncbi:TPA: tryptophan--tRNA ligase [bacterium]|nr:tryptophan--tRNA ligase [bacterium]
MKRVLSGMRPTGRLHLGHLVGALENWLVLQEKYECFYMIADWHALMSEYQNSKGLSENTEEVLLDWLSCGISPDRSIIFCQSNVPEHAEIYLLFSIIMPLGWLKRNPTYKEQIRELSNVDLETHGFLGYPVLQAGDILLYNADIVPIGVDQLPHLELTRELVRRFNHLYGETFGLPEPLLTETPKLLGIDGRKMSKSYNNAIFLSEQSDIVEKKVKQMITDPERIHPNDLGHPDVCSIFYLWKAFEKEKNKVVEEECKTAKRGCVFCKEEIATVLNEKLSPIRKRRAELKKDKELLSRIIKEGNEKARELASKTMIEVRRKIGFYEKL